MALPFYMCDRREHDLHSPGCAFGKTANGYWYDQTNLVLTVYRYDRVVSLVQVVEYEGAPLKHL